MKRLIFGIILLSLVLNVRANTRLISHLDLWDVWTYNYNASHWIEQGNLQQGAQMYGEVRSISLTQVPKYLQGADWIQTAYGSKSFSGNLLATFKLLENAEVYIAHSQNIHSKPSWLKAYVNTGTQIENSTKEKFNLYKRVFHKGDIISLGPNGATANAMYLVVVKAIGKAPIPATIQGRVFDVLKYQAKGDSKTINTVAIQQAIDDCAAAGGGTVFIHDGIFITGTLELKDRVTLFVQAGSILRASANKSDYPEKKCSFRYFRANEHFQLIYAEKKNNIGITGGGIIDGFSHGDGWPWVGKSNEFERPRLIRMVECNNVKVSDISFIRSANWTQLYEGCDHIVINDVRVRAYTGQHNEDGIDISSCNDVKIKNFYAIAGDDVICFKAMSQKPTENVVIDQVTGRYANCHAIKIGTETHGAVRNILVKNVVANARYGIAIESVDGSDINQVTYENFLLTNCSTPLFIRLGDRGRTYEGGPLKAAVGSMQNITIRNVKNTDIGYVEARNGPGVGSAIGGLPDKKIKSLLIENCDFLYYGTVQDTAYVYQDVPENRDKYPEFNIYGTCPAYGLYVRHVDNLILKNVKISAKNLDVRPAIVLDDVADYTLDNLNCEQFPMTTPSVIWHKQKGTLKSNTSINLNH